MVKVKYHGREVVIHEGPMADTRGTSWREDAARLEAADEERIENTMRALPNTLTTMDKAHAVGAKGDGGTVDVEDLYRTVTVSPERGDLPELGAPEWGNPEQERS